MKNSGRGGDNPYPEKVQSNHGTEAFKGSGTLEIVDYHFQTNISWIEVI